MKSSLIRLTLILTLFLSVGSLTAMAEDPFMKLADRNDVESTYISKEMLSFVNPNLMRVGRLNLSNQMGNITSIIIINSEKSSGVEACRKTMESFISSNRNVVTLMRDKDETDITTIYAITDEKKPSAYSAIMLYETSKDGNSEECQIVLLRGALTIPQQQSRTLNSLNIPIPG